MPIWRGTTSTDWGTASNWDTGAIPTGGTDAIFDATSTNPCTTGAGTRICRDLITTGFTNVLTVGTSATLGYIQVYRNITLGSTAGHIAGLSYIGIFGATCTLDVATGFTVPYLSFGAAGGGGTCTVTLVRSFAVTTLFKTGTGGSLATVTAGSAMSIDLTNGNTIGGTGTIILNANVTLRLFGTTTYGNNISISGNVTSQAGSTINLSSFLNHAGGILNLSAGTVVPGTSILNQQNAFSLNMGTNELYSFAWAPGTNITLTLLSNIVIQSCYHFTSGGASVISGAFNITVKGTVSLANHTYAGGKLILTGDGTSADALATFSGTTMTVTAFTLGSIYSAITFLGRIAIGQTITGPGIPANTVVVAQLTGTANQLGTYQVSNSFTLGSTAIKGTNCAILGAANTNTIEIDASANAFAYVAGLSLGTFRYLSTNTGAYSASIIGTCVITTIDFQGIGSSTRFIRNLSIGAGGIAQNTTILSDVWIQNLICISLSGILQSGVRKLYVLGNATINNGTTASFVIQPEVVLYGSDPCTFTCTALNANITIDKVGGTVTNMSNFTYGTTIGAPYTFKLDNGTFIHGPYLTTITAAAIFNTPGVNWNNITVSTGVTVTINALLNITGSLLCSGSATFAGTHGFTTQNFTSIVAASIITLQNTTANPLAEYIVNGVLTLLGTAASRITLQAAGSATFNGTITPVGQLNYLSGTIPAIGMTVSQTTGVSPVGLIGLLPSRPVITGGTSPTFTISPSATTVIGTPFSMRAGYKAKFTLTNGTGSQNVAYTTTQDIDSSLGLTITSFGSYSDSIGQPSANLFRTLNWGPLIAPSGSVYYTFVN